MSNCIQFELFLIISTDYTVPTQCVVNLIKTMELNKNLIQGMY